jgi:beta-lactamase class A
MGFNLIDPERNVYDQKDMIVNVQPIREYYDQLVKEYEAKAEISIYFEVLNTGANIAVNKDSKILPVSLAKLPLSMIILNKVENGLMSLEDKITIEEDDLNSQSGSLYKTAKGQTYTVAQLIEYLIHDSDNTAFNALRQKINELDIRQLIDAVGLEDLFKSGGQVSAKEYSRLLRALYSSSFLNDKHSDYLLEVMTKTKFKDFLSKGLPGDTPFAHKWGGEYNQKIYADSGIVYVKNRPYIISVTIRGLEENIEDSRKTGMEIMEKISRETYQYITGY